MTTAMAQSVLTEEMLERFRGRAGDYDRENRFFQEDFDELKESGYLLLCVPKEFGGTGLTLAEVRDAAGHSSIATTSIYTHALEDDGTVRNVFAFERLVPTQ